MTTNALSCHTPIRSKISNTEAKFEIYLKFIKYIGNFEIPKQNWKCIRNAIKLLEIWKSRSNIGNLLEIIQISEIVKFEEV